MTKHEHRYSYLLEVKYHIHQAVIDAELAAGTGAEPYDLRLAYDLGVMAENIRKEVERCRPAMGEPEATL